MIPSTPRAINWWIAFSALLGESFESTISIRVPRSSAVDSIPLRRSRGAVNASAGPSAAELEQAHWQPVVDHYRGLYQTTAGASASEATYWQQVVDYHEAQWAQR